MRREAREIVPPGAPPGRLSLGGFGYAAGVRRERARLDAAAAQASVRLCSAGVGCIVLKGPITADWLYAGDRLPHRYGDIDLLVGPGTICAATAVLVELGYEAATEIPVDPELRSLVHAREFRRESDAVKLDLHWRLPGATADPAVVWDVLLEHSEPRTLGEVEILALDESARLVGLAIHVTQRGPGEAKAADDLRRGLATTPDAGWRAAFDLAGMLGARPAMVAGLRSIEAGRGLADRLGLPPLSFSDLLAGSDWVPRGATRLLRLATAPGWRARLGLVRRGLWPPDEAICGAYPIARRGSSGVLVARAWHLGIAPIRLALAMIALRRAAGRLPGGGVHGDGDGEPTTPAASGGGREQGE
jgi:hypothetical protein